MTSASHRWILVFALLAAASATHAVAGEEIAQGHASPPPPTSPQTVPIDAATLAALPREAVTANAHGKTLQCEGVALPAVLRAANALPAEPLRGGQLANYVLVTARDGYRAVFSLAELEPSLSNRKVLLVDRCDGQPLDGDDGPLRLIAPEESRPARWVRQVQSITVVTAP
ncbi:molybdopterin-binding protein [Pseudoxanthomonas yeongjuensis]|uniref:molybdopterin-dependent oxidoreductase n=1 Tax=Pseudoxanthomonas yeongjuensis TaxID=377616 RepID=UPI0013914131|nr:molybdopterin-dependent oxidoreductase [Pseudoxanthomonas yeongjuensis]KAF1716145.1 molybdopterin-binding protein [Pseudoxanthomonas yeongjuensis]